MGLPVRQRRVLDRIERSLRGSDPKLAALYAIFARLNRGEEMPRAEQLRHGAILVLAWLIRMPSAIGARLHIRLAPRQRAVLFFPLAVALAVTSIVFAARSSSSSCSPVQSVAASKNVAKPTKLCRVPITPGMSFSGH